jgi:hypothetical protein
MIRAIANKPLDLSNEEFQYCLELMKAFGDDVFYNTFDVEESESSLHYGFISLVKPPLNKSLPMGVVYFLLNCMLNQRVRRFDEAILKMEQNNVGK